MTRRILPAWEQPIVWSETFRFNPGLNRIASLLCNFELNRCACFLLNSLGPTSDLAADAQIRDTQPQQIASAKFAIDR